MVGKVIDDWNAKAVDIAFKIGMPYNSTFKDKGRSCNFGGSF